MTTTPLSFLESVSGYSQQVLKGAMTVAPSLRLAVIDPTYVASSYPTTLPKVTFEGDDTLSEKRYPVVTGYWPAASDRVVMLPVGHTYVILGSISQTDAAVRYGNSGDFSKTLRTSWITVTVANATDDATGAVSFGSSPFKSGTTPRVIAGISAPGNVKSIAQAQSVTNTGFTVRVRTVANVSGNVNVTVDWIAIGEPP